MKHVLNAILLFLDWLKTAIDGPLGQILIIFVYAVVPVIYFMQGLFCGLALKWLFGGAVVSSLNTIFGTGRFTEDLILILCGFIALIGSYFRSSYSSDRN